jgi:hypothetical protein
MLLSKNISCNQIDIWSPRYNDSKVLIAKYKIGIHNRIRFTKAKHLAGKEYYINGSEIVKHPLESNTKIACYAVPIDELQLIEDPKDVLKVIKEMGW